MGTGPESPCGGKEPPAISRVWIAPESRRSGLWTAALSGLVTAIGLPCLWVCLPSGEKAPVPPPEGEEGPPPEERRSPTTEPDPIRGFEESPAPSRAPGQPLPRGSRNVNGHHGVFLVDPVDRSLRGRVVLDYDGKYAGDPRWDRRVAEISDRLEGDIEFVRGRLGLGNSPAPRFLVRFCDAKARDKTSYMTTYAELHGGEVTHSILVQTEPLMGGVYDLRMALRHEIVHCWQMAGLGEAFWNYPRWIVEGLADWGSDHGEDRVDRTCLDFAANPGGDPVPAIVDGLEGTREFVTRQYAEAYLAFRMVEEQQGLPVARRLASDLTREPDFASAFRRATGLAFPAFEDRATAWARARVASRLPDRPLYLAAKSLFLERSYSRAIPLYEEYLKGAPQGVFRPLAFLELGICRIYTRSREEAKAMFREAGACGPAGYLAGRLDFWRIRIGILEGDMAAVREGCTKYLLDHADGSLRNLEEVNRNLRRAEEALSTANRTPGPGRPR